MSKSKEPKNCDNCRHAIDYWPMYVGDDQSKWGTVRCAKEWPTIDKRRSVTNSCGKWEEVKL